MFHTLTDLLAPAAMDRLTLLLNHVLGSEREATERLRPHAERVVVVEPVGWPGLLAAPPALAWRVTPAGLLEWGGPAGVDSPDLRLRVDTSNPARLALQMLAGETPSVQVEGNAQFATDISWLLDHLRWDIEADLERGFGPIAAHSLYRLGSGLASGLRVALRGAGTLAARFAPVPR